MGTQAGDLPELSADCSRCDGLCCVLLPFRRSADFGADKGAGTPCHHLDAHDRCGIHDSLRQTGWAGCATFDCFGAGQHLTLTTYAGRSWREASGGELAEMGAVLTVVRHVHEMIAHLAEVERRSPDDAARAMVAELVALSHADPETVLAADLEAVRARVSPALRAATERLHGPATPMPADLAGADLRDRSLVRADLRGAFLVRADLRGADLARADLLGADLRDADVRGARLADAWFLSQSQLNATRGDAHTTVPGMLYRPGHWG
jgi:hypothetical protein